MIILKEIDSSTGLQSIPNKCKQYDDHFYRTQVSGIQSKLCHLVAKYASGAIWWSNVQLMLVVTGQVCNEFKWHHLVAKFATYASGAIWWPNMHLVMFAQKRCIAMESVNHHLNCLTSPQHELR